MSAKQSPLAELLVRAIELIDQGAVPEKSPHELALEIIADDFEGADINTRIGVGYLKGRLQNLEESLTSTRSSYNELTTQLRTRESELRQERYAHGRTQQKLEEAESRLALLDSEAQEDPLD